MHRRGVGAGAIAKKKLAEASALYFFDVLSIICKVELALISRFCLYLGKVQRKRNCYRRGPDRTGNWFLLFSFNNNGVNSCLCKMSKQLETFKSNLEEFASKHKQEIRKNPQFRVQFQEMCATIGVDPLACEF